MRINQNVMANNASRNLANTNSMLGKSMEKLSSGFRINRAADDAAGLVISQGLRAQVSGLTQATRNAQDAISVVQTAEGALNEVHTMLTRMRDLSVQAANTGGNDSASRAAAQSEINQLATEINRVSADTKFGGTALLDGSYGVKTTLTGTSIADNGAGVAVGTIGITIGTASAITVTTSAALDGSAASAKILASDINKELAKQGSVLAGKVEVSSTPTTAGNAKLTISFGGLASGTSATIAAGATATALGIAGTTTQVGTGGSFQIGANSGQTVSVAIGSSSATTLGVNALDVTTDAGAAAAITALDTAITSVSTTRGNLGAMQNRFDSMINNLQVTTENLSASESRIRDTDMAQEMVTFTKSQVLMQAGTAMLAQANQIPQSVLKLLG